MLTLKNEALQVLVDPEHGGRIVSFVELRGGTEFVCYDLRRLPVDPSLDYDGNFAGGFDELLPNDPPEDGFPDHGELWTLPLTAEWEKDALRLSGTLPLSRLRYERRMCLDAWDFAHISRTLSKIFNLPDNNAGIVIRGEFYINCRRGRNCYVNFIFSDILDGGLAPQRICSIA